MQMSGLRLGGAGEAATVREAGRRRVGESGAGHARTDDAHRQEAPEVQIDADDRRDEPEPDQRDELVAAAVPLPPRHQSRLGENHDEPEL